MNDKNLIIDLLRKSPAFDHLIDDALIELSVLFSMRHFQDSALLPIRRGHSEPYLYIVASGSFNFNLLLPDADDLHLLTLKPTDLAGGFLSHASHHHESTITSNGSSVALQILKKDLSAFFELHAVAFTRFNSTLQNNFHQAQCSIFFAINFQIHDPNIFHTLAAEVEWKELKNGDILFRQDDPGDAIFMVLSGRLKAVTKTADGESTLSNIINAGEVSGEVALLTNSPRNSTVFAIRDSVAAKFSRKAFHTIAQKHPQSMFQISKLLGKRLKRQSSKETLSDIGKTYALIPSIDEGCLHEFSDELANAMQEWGSIICLTSDDIDKALGIKGLAQESGHNTRSTLIAQWLEQQEREYDHILLIADCSWSHWNEKVLRHSDHLLIIADATQDCEPSEHERKLLRGGLVAKHQKKSLILVHPNGEKPIAGTKCWLQNRQINDWWHIRQDKPKDMQRLGRVLTGNANVLVLGGGGARGYAHIGVIRALEELHVPIDKVCGTSIGAIISSGIAIGYDHQGIAQLCKKHLRKLFDYTLPLLSLIRGRIIEKELNAAFGELQIEDLPIPFFCISTNLTRAEQIVHDRGSLKDALRCSMSLPAMIPPVCKNGDLIVDGGLLNNLPIDEMRKSAGSCRLIAVDISPKLDLANNEDFPSDASGLKLLISRINPFQKSIKTPSILGVLERSITVAAVNYSMKVQEKNMADLYLELPVETVSTLAYGKVDQIANLGYTASINKIKKWLSDPV